MVVIATGLDIEVAFCGIAERLKEVMPHLGGDITHPFSRKENVQTAMAFRKNQGLLVPTLRPSVIKIHNVQYRVYHPMPPKTLFQVPIRCLLYGMVFVYMQISANQDREVATAMPC